LADKGTQVLVVAEMSLIFNDVVATDRLIEWANNELHAEVCLLEHCLPGGGSHPFAAKLLRDYQKDQTPLKGLYSYQTASSQIRRFQKRGWSSVNAYDLWEFWTKIDDTERELIHKIDPFDDWEDLILLTRHLLVLHARNGVQQAPVPGPESAVLKPTKIDAQISCHPLTKNPKRRFGALMQDTTTEGAELLISLMGQDTNGLSDNYDALTFSQGEIITYLPASGPSSRSCFTITDLGHAGVLVIGGRSTALDRPLSDCWLYVRGRRPHWKKTWDMPAGLYRHSAIRLGQSSMALVLGGRSAGSVSSSAYVYHPDNGWRICVDENPVKPALFGAAAWNVNEPDAQSSVGKFQGLVCGGLTGIGNPNLEVYRWYLDTTGVQVGPSTPGHSRFSVIC
jgi:tRNA wybutosine-synthesizing protein 4